MGISTALLKVSFMLNGTPVDIEAAADQTLLEVLRSLGLHGCRESCAQGVCGTCTVLLDRRTVASCILFAHLADGAEIETIEGLASEGGLSAVQQAFIAEAGFQCGFCTPGMILSATQLLRDNPDPDDREIAEYLAGNLCRCGAYPEIFKAVHRAAETLRSQG